MLSLSGLSNPYQYKFDCIDEIGTRWQMLKQIYPHLVCEHLPNVYHIQFSVQVIVKSLTYIHEILRMKSVNPDNTRLYHIYHVEFFL
jgi:hypothetical protein